MKSKEQIELDFNTEIYLVCFIYLYATSMEEILTESKGLTDFETLATYEAVSLIENAIEEELYEGDEMSTIESHIAHKEVHKLSVSTDCAEDYINLSVDKLKELLSSKEYKYQMYKRCIINIIMYMKNLNVPTHIIKERLDI